MPKAKKTTQKVKALSLPAFTSAFSLLHTSLFDLTHSNPFKHSPYDLSSVINDFNFGIKLLTLLTLFQLYPSPPFCRRFA
jgi:hypothetical protein